MADYFYSLGMIVWHAVEIPVSLWSQLADEENQ